MIELIINRTGEGLRRHPVTGDTTLIGKSPECDVVLPSSIVSRRHACIELRSGRAGLRDLHSLNGTYVNGRRIQAEHRLKKGDVIEIGDFQLTYWEADSDEPTQPQERRGDVLRIDPETLQIWIGSRRVQSNLRPQEMKLLLFLASRRGRVVSVTEIGDHIWGAAEIDGRRLPQYELNNVHQLVSRLKRSLRAEVEIDRYVSTAPGFGYRLEEQPS